MIDYSNNSATRRSASVSLYIGIFFFPYIAISLFCLSKLYKNKFDKINKNVGVINSFANIVAVNTIVFGFAISYILKAKYGDNVIPGLVNGFNTPLSASFGILGITFTIFAIAALPIIIRLRYKFDGKHDIESNNECANSQKDESNQKKLLDSVKRDLTWCTIIGLFLNTTVYLIEKNFGEDIKKIYDKMCNCTINKFKCMKEKMESYSSKDDKNLISDDLKDSIVESTLNTVTNQPNVNLDRENLRLQRRASI